MLGVILKILSVLGSVLLILFVVLIFVLLLVLFMPIVYKADADKTDTELKAEVRGRWLFGFLRVNYNYPEPGNVIVKVLWITVFDSSKKKLSTTTEKQEPVTAVEDISLKAGTVTDDNEAGRQVEEDDSSEEIPKENKSLRDKLFAKYEKIKYTIQTFCDKIKHIWENLDFYKKLLEDEETKLLFSHVCKRLGRVLSHIRPKRIKANVVFGAESPDTTGYVYGIYCMFSPKLGKDVCVVPDFEKKILQGTVCLTGYITIFKLLVNALAVLFDKRLQLFIKRLKKHSAKQAKVIVTANE